ncbi:FliG C-terminal domain-containing protein [Henriciella sp.]|uniref:FliG C-terminal domain-containing protein n=1 Tax=Henriciella sp. TaxID=1968823 RepID=UPI002624F71D|nr:FliG C-terminal domain-containing protein [Henriciella sp.]
MSAASDRTDASKAKNNLRAVPTGQQESRVASISRAQRAAVVIAMLGETAAKPVVDKLDDRALAQVAEALETVSYLAREELAEIVIDFLQHLRSTKGAFRGGPDRAREIVTGLLDDNRFGVIFGDKGDPGAEAPDRDGTWARLEKRDPKKTAAYMSGLTPNIIALILRKLDVSVSSEIVTHLDDEKLDPMIGLLVESGQSDPEIDSVIARMVDIEFLNNQEESAEEGDEHLQSVGELLSLIPSDRRDRLMAVIKNTDENKMASIQRVIFTIDGLPDMLGRASVPVVFRELGEDTMVRLLSTLGGTTASVQEYLLGNISSRLADQYRDQLEDAGSVTPAEAEVIQREFLTSLMSMKRRGMIVLEKPAAT